MPHHPTILSAAAGTAVLASSGGVHAGADRLIACAWFGADALTCHLDDKECSTLVPTGAGGLGFPHSVTLGPDGLLYITSIATNSVLRYNAVTGDFVDEFITPGLGGLNNPTKIVFDDAGSAYVTSFSNNRVIRYDADGGSPTILVGGGAGGLNGPESITIGPDGQLYVSSRFTNSVKKYSIADGSPLGDFVAPGVGGLAEPFHMHFSDDGSRFYVGSSLNDTVAVYDGADGSLIDVLIEDDPETPEDETGGLDNPHDVTIGPDGRMYVASFNSDEILVYDPDTGAFVESIGGLDGPQETAFLVSNFVEPDVKVILTFVGEAAGDQFGWVSNKLGDQDGDGRPDLIITAPTNDAGGANAGRVYVFSSNPASAPTKPIHVFTGIAPGMQLGNNVGDAGDVNGDGISDIQAGGPGAGGGRVFVYSGADGSVLYQLAGDSNGDGFGQLVCPAGDFTGDGVPEIMVGAPGDDPNGVFNAGSLQVFDGADGAFLFRVDGPSQNAQLGSSGAPLGDLTGDGVPDFIVAAPNAGPQSRGRGYVYSGDGPTLLCTLDNGPQGFTLGSLFCGTPGDVDGDGVPEIYISDFNYNNSAGRAWIYRFADGACEELYVFDGDAPNTGLGIGNSQGGDVNNDGLDDVLLGLWIDDDGANNAGSTHIFSGADGSLLRTVTSTVAGETLGFDAHTMCDVTGNGVPDMLLTAAWNSEPGFQTGKVYLVEGAPVEPPPGCPEDLDGSGVIDSPDLNAVLAEFGCTDGCAADVDGSGATDSADLNLILALFGAGCP